MQIWIVVWSLWAPLHGTPVTPTPGAAGEPALRYRGIERLFAKFEAEQAHSVR